MNILFVCSSGASTSLIVNAMQKEAIRRGNDWKIEARSVQDAINIVGKFDVILIAPQIRYQKKLFEKKAKLFGFELLDINPIDYGACNIEAFFKLINDNYRGNRNE